MSNRFCPRCGLSLQDGDVPACARCELVFAAADPARANFDPADGRPIGERLPSLRCWHCGQPIERDTLVCTSCGTELTRRASASVRYDVAAAPRTPPASAPPPEPLAPPVSEGDAPPREAPRLREGPRGNYFRRHWRGQLPLGVSVWVNVFLLSFVMNLAFVLLQRPLVWSDSGATLFAVSVSTLVARLIVLAWQIVGVWRSAGASIRRRRREHRTFAWAVIARVWIVLVGLGWIAALATVGVLGVRDNFELAFLEDPEIPGYAIEVTPNGMGVLVTGGIRFGIAGDLKAALDANPLVRTVYLTSEGGRMGPGGALYRLIRDRGLDTYALGPCYSACTLAFAGGSNRFVGRMGELGFHSPSLDGERSYGIEQSLVVDLFQPYREAGFSDVVIVRARATAPDDMWIPTDAILDNGNVVTAPRDSVSPPTGVPVAAYLETVERSYAPYLPIELTEGAVMESVAADGDRLTLVLVVDRLFAIPAIVFAPEPPVMCTVSGAPEGATLVFIARYGDGEEIVRTEFSSSACAV